MAHEYEKVSTPADGLRLHLNENTAGCSPNVLAALHAITREQAAFYPDYDRAITVTAARLGVGVDEVLLVNGLDEGILAAAVSTMRPADAEGLVIVPAFDMYAACIDAAGGAVVSIPLNDDFSFPIAAVESRINSNTRLLFLTNPNNPTGQLIPRSYILDLARQAPHAMIFVDEAYADFSGQTLITDREARMLPNIVIGRTFAKAYGLAGLRAGAVIANPDTLARLRRIVPPYSINVCAAVAIAAGLDDREYYDWYVDQVRASKSLLYGTLDRVGVRYWESAANFVLVRLGARAGAVIDALAARQIYVRDRSKEADGCIRITTGVLEHTRVLVTALEEVLCDAA
jgi:histidinol-phosphate aminotransferase